MTLGQQERVLADMGVERLYLLPFDAEMAELSAHDFVHDVLVEGLGVQHVAGGFDVTFGRARSGDPELLRKYGVECGFSVSIAPPVTAPDGTKCSSSVIREHLREGRPEHAAALLGRPFAIEGAVVHGAKLARKLGFPTANIGLEDYLRPAFGIYASRTRLADGREVPGVSYVGRRPTVNGVEERLEAHLFDFDEDLYGQTLETDLVSFIRPDVKFDSLEEMTAQIWIDVAAARTLLTPPF
jgi:riboflavin kinase/FMN adenylyltransferase